LDQKLAVFLSPAVRERLEQGAREPLIRELLACVDLPTLQAFLIANALREPGLVDLINLYLKKVVVRVVRISDFKPSINFVERGGITDMALEFQAFLEREIAAIPPDD